MEMRTGIRLKLLFLLLFSGLFILPSCETKHTPLVPYVKVYISLDIYADLGSMGVGTTRIFPNDGYHGVVLYREGDLIFRAYELTCTEYPEHDAGISEHESFDGIFVCPKCTSTYIIINDAFPSSGPSEFPLEEYHSQLQGNLLIISN